MSCPCCETKRFALPTSVLCCRTSPSSGPSIPRGWHIPFSRPERIVARISISSSPISVACAWSDRSTKLRLSAPQPTSWPRENAERQSWLFRVSPQPRGLEQPVRALGQPLRTPQTQLTVTGAVLFFSAE